MLSIKTSLSFLLITLSLLLACCGTAAIPGTEPITNSNEPMQVSAAGAGGACAFMEPKDYNLINGNDKGRLTIQHDGSWTASDSHGVVKWKVIPSDTAGPMMAANRDLRGPLNVIVVVFKSGKPFAFYISSGQICRGQATREYSEQLKLRGNPVSAVYHYQRYKVAPKAVGKGAPPP